MLALLLLVASIGPTVQLMDERVTIPPSEWRYVDVILKQSGAIVTGTFRVSSGGSGVRVVLISREDLPRLRAGRGHDVVGSTGYQMNGSFRFWVTQPGDYALVIDNRMEARGPAQVDLRVALDFSPASGARAGYPSPARRFIVIVAGLALFFGIVSYAAFRLRNIL